MLGHKLPGNRGSYMIPDTQTLLEGTKEAKGYVAAINELTINEENRLKKENQELKENKQDTEYIIKGQLQEVLEQNKSKDEEIAQMRQAMKVVLGKVEQIKNDVINNNSRSSRRKETNNNPSNDKLKMKELKNSIENIKNEMKQQQILTTKLLEIYQKRDEIISKKGFVTKEDQELIDKTILEDIKQITDPDLLKKIFSKSNKQAK